MGFYGTLKMIFYKVSRISACLEPPASAPSLIISCLTRSVALIIFDAPLAADRTATAEDEAAEQTPRDAALIARAYMLDGVMLSLRWTLEQHVAVCHPPPSQ